MRCWSYCELGPLLHDFISKHSGRNGPLLLLLTPNGVWYRPGTAGVLYRRLQSAVHSGPYGWALVGRRWRPASGAAGLMMRSSVSTSLVVPSRPADGRRRWAAGNAAQRRRTLWPPVLAVGSRQCSVHRHWNRHEGRCHPPWANSTATPQGVARWYKWSVMHTLSGWWRRQIIGLVCFRNSQFQK